MSSISRRMFLRNSAEVVTGTVIGLGALTAAAAENVKGANERINIAMIGCGGRGNFVARGLIEKGACLTCLCDLQAEKLEKSWKFLSEVQTAKPRLVKDMKEVFDAKDVDAVVIATPDHWHAQPVIEAVLAGKDIYVQKPLTMTVVEGRAVSDVIREKGRAFQIGSQQRSEAQFRMACELVRNGRIGKLHTVKVGLPTDPSGGKTQEMPVPSNLNYDAWLGCTPLAPYTEDRVHSQNPDPKKRYGDRPGWLRIDSYCLGMITGWGAHHVDIGHWGMDTELTGPISIEGKAEFPTTGLWNVHGPYHIESKYANGVTMIIDNKFTTGVRFEGTDGWIFVSRGSGKVTASDPASGKKIPLDASNPDIIKTPLGEKDIRLHVSEKGDHHMDWIKSIKTRKPAATSPEQAHRSCTACIVGWISMKLGRKLAWDPEKEKFVNDDQANAMLSRPQRAPYGMDRILKKT